MELDFTAIDSIKPAEEKQSYREPITYEAGNLARQLEKPATGENKSHSGAIHRLQKLKQEKDKARKMYAEYQQNIRRAGTLRSDITKGINKGEDPIAILLKAVECISLMTGDSLIYTQNRDTIRAVYGWGLGETAPLKTEYEAVQGRLAMLQRPELLTDALEPQEKQRIANAIKSHEKRLQELQRVIEEGARHEF